MKVSRRGVVYANSPFTFAQNLRFREEAPSHGVPVSLRQPATVSMVA